MLSRIQRWAGMVVHSPSIYSSGENPQAFSFLGDSALGLLLNTFLLIKLPQLSIPLQAFSIFCPQDPLLGVEVTDKS
jgi:hypothetical protein